MSLWFSFDAIALIQTGIEPLRTVRNTHLVQDGVHQFFIKNLRILFRSKIFISFSPHPPAIGHSVCHLLCRCFPTKATIILRNTCFSKIFLSENIGCNLAPLFRYFNITHFKYYLTTGIADYGSTVVIFEHVKHVLTLTGEATGELQTAFSGSLFFNGHS